MQSTQIVLGAALLALATAMSALFASLEGALAGTRRKRLEKRLSSGKDRVKAVLETDREIRSGLLAARVGTALAHLLGGWAAAGAVLAGGGGGSPGARAAFAVTAFLAAGLFMAVFGQLLPRNLVKEQGPFSNAAARALAAVVWPVAAAAGWITEALLRIFRRRGRQDGELKEDEANLLLLSSYRMGEAGAAQRELIGRVFGFAEDTLRDAMTPRSDVACVSSTMRVREALDVVRHLGFTRYPVCEGGKDRVIGVVHFRDLIEAADAGGRRPVTDVMRPALSLDADLPLSEALAAMRRHRAHMAVVVDESGDALGIATVDDILTRMVSEPQAEAFPRGEVREAAKGVYEFGGDLLVEDVEDALDVDLEHAGVATIGGYIAEKFGRRPKVGDSIKISGFVFDVMEMRGPRIASLRAQRSKEVAPLARHGEG